MRMILVPDQPRDTYAECKLCLRGIGQLDAEIARVICFESKALSLLTVAVGISALQWRMPDITYLPTDTSVDLRCMFGRDYIISNLNLGFIERSANTDSLLRRIRSSSNGAGQFGSST